MTPLLSMTETAKYLKIHYTTLWQIVQGGTGAKRGHYPPPPRYIKIGKVYRFALEDLDEWMRDQMCNGGYK